MKIPDILDLMPYVGVGIIIMSPILLNKVFGYLWAVFWFALLLQDTQSMKNE